jgi:hypothetical protein
MSDFDTERLVPTADPLRFGLILDRQWCIGNLLNGGFLVGLACC